VFQGGEFQSSESGVARDADIELVDRLRAGDERAFMTLLERHSAAMLRLASVYLPRAVAEEIVQDTWLGVLQGIGSFEARSTLKTWIFAILMNRTRTQLQREGRSVPFSAMSDPATKSDEPAVDPNRFIEIPDDPLWPYHWAASPKSWGDSPEDRLLSKEVQAEIQRAIEALPPDQREVITLCDIEGWEPAEVTTVLGISAGNQRVRLHRARSKVRRALELYFGEE
jgi:RNA polymerase sigma-70 factor, ECF subfamily